MAVGEYVSVCSQSDLEEADLVKERWEIAHNYEKEVEELSELYQTRGLGTYLSRLENCRKFFIYFFQSI